MLTIALSKGRILDDTLPLLAAAGIVPTENPDKSRKLIIPTTQDDVRLLIVRATDVPTYVEHGAADLGVAGKDVLMEYGGQGLYEPLDLRIANCKLMTAGKVGAPEPKGRLRVATKFVNVAKRYYAEQGRQVDIIKLYGSMELAPLVGLADKIIDVVDTGNTLRANGLEPQELIAHISSRLVVNKASMKMQHARIQALIDTLHTAVEQDQLGCVPRPPPRLPIRAIAEILRCPHGGLDILAAPDSPAWASCHCNEAGRFRCLANHEARYDRSLRHSSTQRCRCRLRTSSGSSVELGKRFRRWRKRASAGDHQGCARARRCCAGRADPALRWTTGRLHG